MEKVNKIRIVLLKTVGVYVLYVFVVRHVVENDKRLKTIRLIYKVEINVIFIT